MHLADDGLVLKLVRENGDHPDQKDIILAAFCGEGQKEIFWFALNQVLKHHCIHKENCWKIQKDEGLSWIDNTR